LRVVSDARLIGGLAKLRDARLCTAKLDENVVRPLEALSAEI
jgi:hypothetical protein